jgi:hypothetical protein
MGARKAPEAGRSRFDARCPAGHRTTEETRSRSILTLAKYIRRSAPIRPLAGLQNTSGVAPLEGSSLPVASSPSSAPRSGIWAEAAEEQVLLFCSRRKRWGAERWLDLYHDDVPYIDGPGAASPLCRHERMHYWGAWRSDGDQFFLL